MSHVLARRPSPGGSPEYLVRLLCESPGDCAWLPPTSIPADLLSQFSAAAGHRFDRAFAEVEKIIAARGDPLEYLVKWQHLDYDELTWEPSESLRDSEAVRRFDLLNRMPSLHDRFSRQSSGSLDFRPIVLSPQSSSGSRLSREQLDCLNFLLKSWADRRNSLVVCDSAFDQLAAFLKHLFAQENVKGPFLLVVRPNAIAAWESAVHDWSGLRSVTFSGPSFRLRIMREYEFFYANTKIPKFHVLITTSDDLLEALDLLSSLAWKVVAIERSDDQNDILGEVMSFNSVSRIFLTADLRFDAISPVVSIVEFLSDEGFRAVSDWEPQFSELRVQEQLIELLTLLRPVTFLHRSRPSAGIEEIVVSSPMTPVQRDLYESIFQKHRDCLAPVLRHVFSDLKKVCNHPFLIAGPEEQIVGQGCSHEALLRSSGKLLVLDKLLAKLKASGRRVLLFSHFSSVLDIIQDFLSHRHYLFERIDGSVRGDERRAAIDRFNAINSPDFVCLVCAARGGLDIHLAPSDAAVIFDSDRRPMTDLHAVMSCRPANATLRVYRLVTPDSHERRIFDREYVKMALSIPSGSHDDDIGTILKFHTSLPILAEAETMTYTIEEIESAENNDAEVEGDFWTGYVPEVHDTTVDCEEIGEWMEREIRNCIEGLASFGWGRWEDILRVFRIEKLPAQLRAAAYNVLLRMLQLSSPGTHPIALGIARRFGDHLKLPEMFADVAIEEVDRKLNAIEAMYFVNELVGSCPRRPSGLVVPRLPALSRWKSENDKVLLNCAYENGWAIFTSLPEASIGEAVLERRLCDMVTELRRSFMSLMAVTNELLPFNCATMKRALQCWTRDEQRAVVELLLRYGYPNADDFAAVFGTTRSPGDVAAFVGHVLAFCAGDESVIRQLPEGIPADRGALVRNRVQMFETARKLAKRRSFSYEDQKTLQAVARGGFLEVADEDAQAKIIQLISDLAKQAGLEPVKKVARPLDVDVDGNGRPVLPLSLGRSLVIVELGTVVVDREAFHSQKYIYPSGFVSERCFASVVDPTAKGWYRSLVLDTGEPVPLFRVELKGDPGVHFDAATPSGAWVAVVRAVAERRVELRLPSTRRLEDGATGLAVSGPEYYGFTNPRTIRLIESLPGVDCCRNYHTRCRV